MSKTAIFVIGIALLLAVQVSAVSLTITCYACPVSTCQSQRCFNLTGSDGYNEVACAAVDKPCITGVSTTVQITNCTVDYKSDNCSTKACFSLADKQIGYFMDATCASPFYFNYTCGTCATGGCSSQNTNICQSIAKSYVNGTDINDTGPSCITTSCSNSAVNIRVDPCTNGIDSLGTFKNCCMTMIGSAAPVCTTDSTVLASAKFQKWATGSTTFEHYFTIISALMICLGLFIA